MKTNQLKKTGAIISATLEVEKSLSGSLIDTEIICPIDGAFKGNERYLYIKSFSINNALYIRYEGLPN